MGGCASSPFSDQEFEQVVRAEWERRIAETLRRATGVSGKNGFTRTDGVVATPLESDLLTVRGDERVDTQQPSQTVFFFDWDDILFPTTWACRHSSLRSNRGPLPTFKKEHEELFREISSRIVILLGQARTVGKVVILTNSSRSWVAECCSRLTPEAKAILDHVPFIYAMELLRPCEAAALPTDVMYKESKSRAMRAILSSMQKSICKLGGWINVVSIGDADCERIAIQEVKRSRVHGTVVSKRCFAKTVRMLMRPSLSQIILQLSVISKWFSEIVSVDADVAINLGKHA